MSVVDSEVRVLTTAERAKHDAIVASFGRKTDRRFTRLARHFALLRWVRGVR